MEENLGQQTMSKCHYRKESNSFFENFVHDAIAVVAGGLAFYKTERYKFQRRNDALHSVSTQVDCVTMNVVAAHCTCKVGLHNRWHPRRQSRSCHIN